ncbi:MAG: right-handed parallel beta-helix repeat-containing protein [Sphingobium sp.]|nr:right-handed parallel beta-helix repeat-containing protein [Sphingobium sp.]
MIAHSMTPQGASAQSGSASFVADGRGYATLSAAVDAIGDRDGAITIAPGTYRQCAVQERGAIVYRAATPGTVIFDAETCEGKASLVLRGRAAIVEGLIFQNLRVPDGNGAGIRLEKGDLSVTNSIFRNSEEGILTASDPQGTITVDRSTFSRLGRCDRGLSCAHSIYVGDYGRLIVTRSRFEAGSGGHYIKVRAPQVEITDNSFDDSQGHTTNYTIDLPNGSAGLIAGNIMVQGKDKENHSAFITIAPEGREFDSSGLVIRNNRASFAPGVSWGSTFVANWTDDKVTISNNQLAGGIKLTDRR